MDRFTDDNNLDLRYANDEEEGYLQGERFFISKVGTNSNTSTYNKSVSKNKIVEGEITMIILSQDKRRTAEFAEDTTLFSVPRYHDEPPKKIFCGINLMCKEKLLGTFDNMNEIIEEMGKIRNAYEKGLSHYYVTGYTDFNDIEIYNLLTEML